VRHLALSVGVVVVALGLSVAAGRHRPGALLGVALSAAAGLASFAAMARLADPGPRLVQRALWVMALSFLGRLVLVALGTVLVVKLETSVWGFVVAFFVVYFVLAGIEGAYVLRQGKRAGSSA